MKQINNILLVASFFFFLSFFSQCASSKQLRPKFEKHIPFTINKIYYQDWYAGIKFGNTGVDTFVSIYNKPNNIKIDSIYFGNLKGKLISKYGHFEAIVQNKESKNNFGLKANEFVISYIESGTTKYYKTSNSIKLLGTVFYDTIQSYNKTSKSVALVTLDQEASDD